MSESEDIRPLLRIFMTYFSAMLFPKDKLLEINGEIDDVIAKISEYETRYEGPLSKVHPNYRKSARNLVHYLALRSFNVNILQKQLEEIELPSYSGSEFSVLFNLHQYKTIINCLQGEQIEQRKDVFLTRIEGKALAKQHTRDLFGKPLKNRKTAIMVTQPTEAAHDLHFIRSLTELGMDCARINCAHDDEFTWKKIIDNIKSVNPDCRIMMDLGGPKLRTGPMKPGLKVIHIKPKRNKLGQVVTPAKIWLAPYGTPPPDGQHADAVVPVNKKWLRKTRPGSYIVFRDARNKKCRIDIDAIEGNGRWASCSDSAFVTTGMMLNVFLERHGSSEIHTVHELLPLEEMIFLFEGDLLRLDREPILGEPAHYDDDGALVSIPHISCTLPQIFDMVREGEPIYFDDGKIEGRIKAVLTDHLLVEITSAKKNGGKLRANKGINLPESRLRLRGLTEKDKKDLVFVAQHADAVNASFVNSKQDVQDLLDQLKELDANIGVVLKIETREGFKNLPSILLTAMQNYPVGVMIARGDLAIETGWKNFAIIQEEILQLSDAAHLPNIWATQVLENLAKKGLPTRAEITDAAMAQRAECVMLNKGLYIERAVKMLDRVLGKMDRIQKKKRALMPRLKFNPISEQSDTTTV